MANKEANLTFSISYSFIMFSFLISFFFNFYLLFLASGNTTKENCQRFERLKKKYFAICGIISDKRQTNLFAKGQHFATYNSKTARHQLIKETLPTGSGILQLTFFLMFSKFMRFRLRAQASDLFKVFLPAFKNYFKK